MNLGNLKSAKSFQVPCKDNKKVVSLQSILLEALPMCEDLKIKIVETATPLFHQYGIKSVSIDDICREMGISKKTFYTVFPQKDELVVEVLEAFRKRGLADVEKRIFSHSSEDILAHFIQNMQKMKDARNTPPLLYDLKKYYPQLFATHMSAMFNDSRNIMERLLQRGIDEGIFRENLDIKMCAFFFAHMHQGIISNTSELEKYVSVKQFMQFVMDLLVRSIVSEDGKVIVEKQLKTK